jgi:hypothetical protein
LPRANTVYLFISIYSPLFSKVLSIAVTTQPVGKTEMAVYRRFMDMLLVEAVSDFPATTGNDEKNSEYFRQRVEIQSCLCESIVTVVL